MTDETTRYPNGRIVVRIDEDLEELIPGYLDNRRRDLQVMEQALSSEDYETVRTLGHQMKGSGGGYGFDMITEVGKSLEIAARENNAQQIQEWLAELAVLLEMVEVVYE